MFPSLSFSPEPDGVEKEAEERGSSLSLFHVQIGNDDHRFCLLLLVSSRTHKSQIVLRRRQEIRNAMRLFPDHMVNDDLRFFLLLLVSSRTHHNQIVLRRRQERRKTILLRLLVRFSSGKKNSDLPLLNPTENTTSSPTTLQLNETG